MGLPPGEKVGPYEVVGPLGKGGMGEVYRARDPRLGREVAIKALPAEVAQDPERRARFEREAQLLASLNHPNIAAIHGLEEAGGAKYLVLEMVEGRTLGEVLAEGPLPPDEAAAIALQIAEALAAAHEKGIIHRDLKPGNVMVTAEHKVKVLDFGLGKALDSDAGRSLDPGATPAQSPTMTIAATQAGLILGTAAYMSPEQAKGRPADRRSDVWGFGCLLYEMLAGKPAFEGEDATEILAHVVRGEPNWEALPGTVPASLRTLTERCLIKDRSKRLSDMSVVRFVLEERRSMSAAAPSGPAAAPTTRWGLIAGLVMAAVILTAGITRYYSGTPATGPGGITRLSVVLPFGDEVEMVQHKPVAIAPDGTSIVYVAGGDGDVPRLYRRTLDRARTEPIPDTEGARAPFFSPDGRWVAFFAGGKLKKVTVEGTGAQVIADAPDSRGGFWAGDDTIYFAPIPNAALMKVRASGGTVETATTLDRAHGEVSHRWPFVTNDGKVLLYSVWTGPGVDEHEIIRQPLPTGERSVLLKGGDDAAYVEPGFLVYGRNDKLLAVAWKPGQDGLEAAAPFTLAETPRLDGEGSSAYAVSRTGTLAYLPGGSQRLARRIVWVDRSGREEPLAVPDRDYESVAISPDGTQAAVQIEEGTIGVWMYDFARRTLTPFETSGSHSSQAPLWSADGSTIYYRGTRKGQRNLYAKSSDAASGEVRLVPKDDVTQTPTSVSADGRWLLYTQIGGVGQRVLEIWALRLDGDKSERKVAEGEDSNGQLSPDGKWLAFESTRSGRLEVYVTPFPGPGASRQISIGGGSGARWSRDGRELFYRGTASFFAVDMGGGGSAPGTPRALYPEIYRGSPNGNSAYDVAPDGSRFLRIRQAQPEGPLNHIDVVLNWATQLGK